MDGSKEFKGDREHIYSLVEKEKSRSESKEEGVLKAALDEDATPPLVLTLTTPFNEVLDHPEALLRVYTNIPMYTYISNQAHRFCQPPLFPSVHSSRSFVRRSTMQKTCTFGQAF